MPSTSHQRIRVVILSLVMLASAGLVGCDVVDQQPENITLTPSHTYDFSFTVSPDDQTVTAQSSDGVSVSQLLEGTFQPEEVISATVTAVELERRQPPGRTLSSLFNSATLDLRNGGSVTVAAMSSPPDSRRGNMSVSGAPDITGLVHNDEVRAAMELSVDVDEQEQYVLSARVQFRIEVEGI